MILTATPDQSTGSVIISGSEMPQGLATVYRYNADGSNTILRGAQNMAVVNGVLYAEDSEADYNIPLRYVLLMNMGDRVVQRNLITNPSFETDTVSWSAGTNRTMTRVRPEVDNTIETPAFVDDYVLKVSGRTTTGGDSTTVPFEAPIARVDADFYLSDESELYEFSFHARLQDNSASYYTDATIVTGGAYQTWQSDFDMYPSWSLPAGSGLTWADLETAYIGVSSSWFTVEIDPAYGWTSDLATWDSVNTLTITPEAAALRARNYVTNPSFNVNTSGYTSSATSGSAPLLSTLTMGDGNLVMQVVTSTSTTGLGTGTFGAGSFGGDTVVVGASVGPQVTFTATGLSVGTSYVTRLDAVLSTGQALNLSVHNGGTVSAGIADDGTDNWMTDSVVFTATSTTEVIRILLLTGNAGPTLIDHVQVSTSEVDYLDGSMAPDAEYIYAWVGTADASYSERIPYGTLYAPGGISYTQYEGTWTVSTADTQAAEFIFGYVDDAGNDLVTPVRRRFNAGGGGSVTVVMANVDTSSWPSTWRPYLKAGVPVATVTYSARYYTTHLPSFLPYEIGVSARVLNSTGAVVMTSPTLGFITVGEWRKVGWDFALPVPDQNQYRIEIVPDVTFPALQTTWQLDGVMLEPNPPHQAGRLAYLDGYQPVPDVSVPGWVDPTTIGDYDVSSPDAVIRWTGTPNASSSEFLGPSQITIVIETTLAPPSLDIDPDFPTCEPIQLSDPTLPELGNWFTLQSISDLTYAARSSSYVVLNRRTPIVVSRTRASATGSLVLLLQTLDERQQLLDLVASGRVVLLRNPNPAYPESGWYLAVDNVAEARIAPDHRLPYRKFTLEFSVVDRPGGLIASVAAPTWADVVAAYTSWGTNLAPDSLLANADTWTDVIRKIPEIQNPLTLANGTNPQGLGTYCAYPPGY